MKADSDCSGVKRPAFLPSNDQASEDGHAGADDYGSFGDPRAATVSVHSESGTEENAEVETCSRTSLLSDQRGRRSTWGPARMVKGMRGPYGGGATVVLPGAETPGRKGKGGKETWAEATENATSEGQEGWQEDHKNTLAQWKIHQPALAEGIVTPTTPADYMASMNAMMKEMAKEQNQLRERVDAEKAARENALTLQEGMNQHMHQLTQMLMEMKEEVKRTRVRADSRSRDKSTSRTFRRSDSTRGRKERSVGMPNRGGEDGPEAREEPSTRRQRTQLEDGDDRKMAAANASSESE